VLQGELALAEWLQHVPAALSAIAFGPHKGLLQLVLRVLASAGRVSTGGETEASDAAACLLVLLQHPVTAVADQAWASVRKILEGSASDGVGSSASGLLRLLSTEAVMRHVIVQCMARGCEGRVADVGDVLQHMLASKDPLVVEGVPLTRRCYPSLF
jgi:hypothetical protein